MSDIVLPNMGLIQFQVNGDNNTWGGGINTNSAVIDSHNHTDGLGRRVPSAGININDDLSFGTSFAPVNLNRVQFDAITAITDGAQNQSIFVNVADSELYWRTALGNNVQLTAGNSLNVSAFVGGIVGDYTAVGAAEAFVDADKAYTFRDGDNKRARVDAGGVKLIEFGTTETIGVTLQAPTGLTLSYAITMPLAVPASTKIVQMDSSGVLTVSNIIDGVLHHGDDVISMSAVGATQFSGSMTRSTDGSVTSTSSAVMGWALPINVGMRVKSVTIAGFGDGSIDPVMELFRATTTGDTFIYATLSITNAPVGWNDFTATAGSPSALASNECIFLRIGCGAGSFTINNIRILFDRP